MTRKQEKIEQIKKNIAATRKSLKQQEECLKEAEAAPDKFPSTEAKALIEKRNDLLKKIHKGIKLESPALSLECELEVDEVLYISRFIVKTIDPILKDFDWIIDDLFNNDRQHVIESLKSQKKLSPLAKKFIEEYYLLERECSALYDEIEEFEDKHGDLE